MKRQLYTFAAGKTRIVRMKRVLAGMFSLLAFTGAGAEGFVPDVNPSALDTAKVVDVEEVVVVASPKENIKLRKQPVSVTLFSGEGLDNLGVTSVKDLTGFVHNLYIPDYGSRLTSSVYIRGIGSRMNTTSRSSTSTALTCSTGRRERCTGAIQWADCSACSHPTPCASKARKCRSELRGAQRDAAFRPRQTRR